MAGGTTRTIYFNADGAAYSGPIYNVAGFWLRETAGATAVVKIYDAASVTGNPVLAFSLAANECLGDNIVPPLRFSTGVYVDVVSGAVEGGLRVN